MSDAALVAVLAVVAGALSLDATAMLQVMVSQPLVAGSVAGLIVGDPALGATVGAALQLVWIGALPVGASPFPDAAQAAVVGVGVAHLLGEAGVVPGWSVAAGVVVALLAGAAGRVAIARLRAFYTRLADRALSRAERGDTGGVREAVALGVLSRFAVGFGLAAAFLGVAVAALRGILPHGAEGLFPTLLWAAPVGAATVAAATRDRAERAFLMGGVVVGLAVVTFL